MIDINKFLEELWTLVPPELRAKGIKKVTAEDLVKEFQQDVVEISKEIKFFRDLSQRQRTSVTLRVRCHDVMEGLIKDRKKLLCKIEHYRNIGTKQKTSSNGE